MRASEILNWPISSPKNNDLNHSRMSAPEKPHCSIRNGSAQMTSAKVSASSVSRVKLMAARRIQPEPLLQQVADRKASLRRLARDGANGQIAEPAEQHHDARQHELLGSEARKRHIAQQRRDDDADSDDPQGYLEPARLVARDRELSSDGGLWRERRQQQADQQAGECHAGGERLHDAERERHEERAATSVRAPSRA